jgi:hypothetical protein
MIEDIPPNSDKLNGFRVLIYPDDLTVITSASKEQLQESLDARAFDVDLETDLRNRGFHAWVGITQDKGQIIVDLRSL